MSIGDENKVDEISTKLKADKQEEQNYNHCMRDKHRKGKEAKSREQLEQKSE